MQKSHWKNHLNVVNLCNIVPEIWSPDAKQISLTSGNVNFNIHVFKKLKLPGNMKIELSMDEVMDLV
ncbi:hypothetical protein AgCh_019674 [Apium graveolens]